MKGPVAFVIPNPFTDTLACFREPIRRLAGEGWEVDVYTFLMPGHSYPCFTESNIRIQPLEMNGWGLVSLAKRLWAKTPKYRWLFTVPQWGLHYGRIIASLAGIPMVCISDEFYAQSDAKTPNQLKWKERERKAHQRCSFTIALSPERGEFIRHENQLGSQHPIYVVPNSTPGPALRMKSQYYHDFFNLPKEKKLLIHAGSLWYESALQLASLAENWKNGWTLVFQGRNFDQIRGREGRRNVYFNSVVLPSSLLDYAVSSAHIGLALYDLDGDGGDGSDAIAAEP